MKKSVKKFGDMQRMKPVIHQFALGAVAMAMVQIANAAVAITNVVPMQIPGQGTEIRVMFNGLPPQPQAYQVEQPSRLILDFDKATQTVKQASIPVSTSEASSVDLAADAQRARLTVNLKQAGAFTTRVEGNTFILKINSAATAATKMPAVVPQTVVATGVTNVGFNRGDKGEGQVVIDLSNPNTPVDVKQQGNKIVVRFLGNKIPVALARRLNVNDFATPVSSVDAFNEGHNGIVNIQSNGSFDYMAYQTDNRLVISVAKKEETTTVANQPRISHKYTGKKISLDFQDIEVRRVLQLLADFTGVNIVTSDSVQGNITLRLKDVPWDQALDIIMKSKNLDKRKNGNVIWVAPVSELLKSEEDEAKAYAQSIKLAPLQSETMQLNYVKAEDVKNMIENAANKANTNTNSSTDEGMRSLLSSRGSIVTDTRTNTVIMNDTAEKIEQLKNIIKQIDLPVKQVMIEARIVRATTDFSRSIGVKWGVDSGTSVSSNSDNLTTRWNNKYNGTDDTISDNLGVDFGASSSSSGTSAASIAFGLISTADTLLTLELSALQAEGQGEVISTPKVMTGDKQEATIKSGEKIPYSTSSANSGTTTTFQDANLELNVTPSITPDGNVQMKLKITKDTVGSLTSAGYVIDTNALQTNVLVNNGETVVLGGIYEDTRQKDVSKVPFLGDLPWIGNLFKSTTTSDSKSELLIFITPRIVDDTVSRNH
ncbi:type IV pilus secretin PilQ family protein [Acinetobacter sp. ME22]|uniref:type IV pilus secretin PilQ n=1 Tax=Acinetobacter sp. ME22 TaxID=2904802 RepID=UPI001EDC4601|nr:type IV pilus secretin PilQ family protein [Acinetobacter sp. ME22]MCG2573853.1 type IV pilus secretin PilQ family protein [Acinetobacter sp. ME22]